MEGHDYHSSNVCFYCGNYAQFQLKNGTWCCSATYQSCSGIKKKNSESLKRKHKEKGLKWFNASHKAWNNGLTKVTDERVRKGAEKYSQNLKNGIITHPQIGKPLSEETKRKISISMKQAHKDGRAHNIGECRWKNEPSYPELFFMKVIKNEFNDKNLLNI